ncbi:MAG: xanthine dehydrogenase family protein molybdopterin-binding subunit [Chloroflexi bacterium]|nr:xanthine dehydrogenase family protein molybdopterin-binding subunit [Chloroflexota bacterium]
MTAVHEQEIGALRKRVEDPRLVRGEGQYVDDIRLPGTDILEVAFVRSDYAHATIGRIDISAALAQPGVVAVWDGEKVKDVARMANTIAIQDKNVSPLPPLAHGTVTLAGYPVVMVAAESRYAARDAAARVEIDYDPLPVVTDPEEALKDGAPLVWPQFGSNVAYHYVKDGGDVDGVFASAEHTLSLRIKHSRLAQVPMELRGILASYDREQDLLTVWRSTQSPFGTRGSIAQVTDRPASSIRVIAPDVGGGFGAKGGLYPDELAVVLLALELDRPVRWTSTRMEDLLFTMQGRDQLNLVDVAYTSGGILTGLIVKTIHNVGGVLLTHGAAPPLRVRDFATGAYRFIAHRAEAYGVYTNTGPTGPYRGAGRPEAAYIAEQAVEAVAKALDLDPVDARRRNFIRPEEFPYKNAIGSVYDSGDYELATSKALELAGYERLRAEQQARRARGEVVGIGVATTIEVSAQGSEYGSVEIQPDGSIVATTGSSSHGQGHETSFAQVVADRLGVPFEKITVRHGDTATMPRGGGTGGSKSLVVGGSALSKASDAVIEKALKVAAAMLEVSVEDLAFVRGGVQVQGAPERRLGLSEIAAAAQQGVGLADGERGLKDDADFAADVSAIPFAATVVVVSVEKETGRVNVERMVVVDDIGTVVNPLIVYGQIAGGVTQGLAEAFYEHLEWDEEGQPLTATLQDYAVPTAHMVPNFEIAMTVTKSPYNPIGAKGVGESGCVSAPPAITNAVRDALEPFGVTDIHMPFTSEKLWRAVNGV